MWEEIKDRFNMIYAPKGKVGEYAAAACNIYNGCTHCCRYCYNTRFGVEKYFYDPAPKKDFIARLKRVSSAWVLILQRFVSPLSEIPTSRRR